MATHAGDGIRRRRMMSGGQAFPALFFVLAFVLVGTLIAGCSGGSSHRATPPLTTIEPPTVAPPAVVTSSTTTTVSKSAPSSTTRSSVVPGTTGTAVSVAGALLTAPPSPTTQASAGPDAECHALVDPGWTVSTCGSLPNARSWLVEHRSVGGFGDAWRVAVMHFSQGKGVWLVDLLHRDDKGDDLSGITVIAAPLTPDGQPTLVVGFRHQGTGQLLDYDLATGFAAGQTPKVAAHRQVYHGGASVSAGGVTDYSAEYPNNEPNCCPAYFLKSFVHYNGSNWVVSPSGRVQSPGRMDF